MLPDPAASQAILVGVAEYAALEDLPAVDNNLTALKEALTDPAIWGLPTESCTVLRQPNSADAVLNKLQRIAALATDTLVIYFAGHGLIDPGNDDELYLALPGSDKERAYRTAVPYGWMRREIQAARVRRKVVILDCCYSGRALGRWMGDGKADLSDRLEIDGTCVLTATARTRRALAPPDEDFTAFTGELIAILTGGIPCGPELLDMDTLYQHLTTRLRAKSLPLPQRGQLDHGGNIALARNRAPTTPPATSDQGSGPDEGRPARFPGHRVVAGAAVAAVLAAAGIVAAVLATSPSAAKNSSSPATGFTVCVEPVVSCVSEMETKPTGILVSADAAGYIKDLSWSDWGSATAVGSGTLVQDNCRPNCSNGTDRLYPVTVKLSHLAPYGNGEQAYATMTVTAPRDSYNETFSKGLVP